MCFDWLHWNRVFCNVTAGLVLGRVQTYRHSLFKYSWSTKVDCKLSRENLCLQVVDKLRSIKGLHKTTRFLTFVEQQNLTRVNAPLRALYTDDFYLVLLLCWPIARNHVKDCQHSGGSAIDQSNRSRLSV